MRKQIIDFIFFDKRDHELIEIVNSVYDEPKSLRYTGKLFYPFFHPLGIKELAESRGLRTAYSIVNLMESIERGETSSRLQALAGLKDDIVDTVEGPMPKNTARVLLQIMKDLVRAKKNPVLQIRLAHDFRMAAFGKPKIIRPLLSKYHLLEMPEEWNQVTFDDRVHDANTLGRKTPTHLILDAWIKGIRRLRVIYYHYIEPRFALELIEAARIMEIDLRIGIEFWTLHRDRYISFTWVSRSLPNLEAFLCFLSTPHVAAFMEEGKAVQQFQEKYILYLLEEFNHSGRTAICKDVGVSMDPVKAEDFLKFVLPGQPTLEYLGEFIHCRMVPVMEAHVEKLNEDLDNAAPEQRQEIEKAIKTLDEFTISDLLKQYLNSEQFFKEFRKYIKHSQEPVPDRLTIPFHEFLSRIDQLHHDYRITLNLDRIRPADILELLYESYGRITRIEIINLKKYNPAETSHLLCITDLQKAISQGSTLKLKRIISKIIDGVKKSSPDDKEDRLMVLTAILNDIDEFKHMFDLHPIELRIGSDSTGKPHHPYGMGFAVLDTLPSNVRLRFRSANVDRLSLPVYIKTSLSITLIEPEHPPRFLSWIPGIRLLLADRKNEWVLGPYLLDRVTGNLVTLGKSVAKSKNGFIRQKVPEKKREKRQLKYLSTKLKNTLKIIIGFIPAHLCFMLTKDWWVLAYLGAVIWFSITGVRNVAQSILGGGGIKRASLLKWNDYVSWDRLADSLLFTGFSVPLLDYLVKVLLLKKTMGITVDNEPVILYAVMGLANGIYLSSHNVFRGLPKGAAVGNLFRSILSIPVAVLLNTVIGSILGGFHILNINSILQKWAAVISKGASDIVACFIEGAADRSTYIRLRKQNIRKKISDLYTIYSKLVMLFPDTEELTILEKSGSLLEDKNSEVRDLTTLIMINSLDLFYFWMYLPRAQTVMMNMISEMTPEEKVIFFQSQNMLRHEHHISRLFVDGVLGRNFSRPLSFYLTSYNHYLKSIHKAQALFQKTAFPIEYSYSITVLLGIIFDNSTMPD